MPLLATTYGQNRWVPDSDKAPGNNVGGEAELLQVYGKGFVAVGLFVLGSLKTKSRTVKRAGQLSTVF